MLCPSQKPQEIMAFADPHSVGASTLQLPLQPNITIQHDELTAHKRKIFWNTTEGFASVAYHRL
jgi:hypothetical protein